MIYCQKKSQTHFTRISHLDIVLPCFSSTFAMFKHGKLFYYKLNCLFTSKHYLRTHASSLFS